MITLWKNRKLSREEQIAMIAEIDKGDEGSVSTQGHAEESEVVVGAEEVTLTEVYATEVPFSVSENTDLIKVLFVFVYYMKYIYMCILRLFEFYALYCIFGFLS